MPTRNENFAKLTLRELVNRLPASFETAIAYSDLANIIGFDEPYSGNGFSDKMSKMLETLGNMLRTVGTRINMNVPQIQSMVVIKGTGLPGEGINTFLPGYRGANEENKIQIVTNEFNNINRFTEWQLVVTTMEQMYP